MKNNLFIFIITNLLSYLSIINCNALWFELKPKRSKCLIEELYHQNFAMIKYTVEGLQKGQEDNQSVLNNIEIKITSEDNDDQVFVDKYLTTAIGKFSFTAPQDGQYRICIYNNDKEIKFRINFLILSDNMDEPSLESALKKEDVFKVHDKVEEILGKANRYIRRQEKIITFNDSDYEEILKMEKIFLYMTMVQIALVVAIGIYQVINFKGFLDKNVLNF